MNYIKETKAFYDWLELNSISTSSIALWHALMHMNNKAGWINEFAVARSVLEMKTGLKKDALYNARNKLKQLGRIDFKERKGNKATIYIIVPFESEIQMQVPTQPTTQTPTQPPTQTPTITKLNKTKQNKKISNIVQIESAKQSKEIFDKWNKSKAGIKHQKLNKDMSGAIDSKISKYNIEVVFLAVERLAVAVNDSSFYYSHKWNIKDFMQQKNGIAKWLDEGQLWQSYMEQKGGSSNGKVIGNDGDSEQTKGAYGSIDWNNR